MLVELVNMISPQEFYYTPVFRWDILCYATVRPSVRQSIHPSDCWHEKHRCNRQIFFKFCTQVCLGVPSIHLLFVLRYLIKYVHNCIISDFSIYGIHRVIFIRLSLDGTYYGMALSVRSSVRPTVSTKKHRCKWQIFFKIVHRCA